jgi:SulP family sulfate permease
LKVETPWETIFSSKYSLPSLASWESWKLILGYGSALFATQFTETAIALNVVDLLDKSQGPGFLVLIGQGGANIVSGLMGGMGGSGVVNMSVLADRTFGTSCLSTFLTGALVFAFITWGYPVIDFIPLSAISGISIATACSFIQWRSIAATFTTCLPNSTRDKLPPQFNIARLDVLIMLIVTAACLIMDVATLLFFVIAVGIFAFGTLRTYLARRKKRKELGDDEDVEDDDNMMYGNKRPTTHPREEIDDIVVIEHETESSKEKDSNLLTACTAAIFPNCV